MFRILPLVSIKWARVRQVMAFNLPLLATSPVSDLDCCRLPHVLQFPDKCVSGFWSYVCRKPHLVHRRLNRHTMKYKRLILLCTQSMFLSPEDSRWSELSRGGASTADDLAERREERGALVTVLSPGWTGRGYMTSDSGISAQALAPGRAVMDFNTHTPPLSPSTPFVQRWIEISQMK